jgi:DNA-binding NarL/FixJ family response regulator
VAVVSAQHETPVRVIVVDDSDVFRKVVSEVAAATPGFEVVGTASSGREALELIGSLGPHLVLTDMHMPDLDGIETATKIHRQHPDVVVLVLTATMRASVADLSVAVGDKRDLSPRWLADFWRRYAPR